MHYNEIEIHMFSLEFEPVGKFQSLTKVAEWFKTATSSIKSVIDRDNRLYSGKCYLFTEEEVGRKFHFNYFEDLKEYRDKKLILQAFSKKKELSHKSIICISVHDFSHTIFFRAIDASEKLEINKAAISMSKRRPFERISGGYYFVDYSEKNIQIIEQVIKIKKEQIKLQNELSSLIFQIDC